jgi:YD repeat-containing protein
VSILDNGEHLTTTMEYDELNNLTQVVDPRGMTTTYYYSSTLLTMTVDALENATYYTYTTAADGVPAGLLKETEDGGETTPGTRMTPRADGGDDQRATRRPRTPTTCWGSSKR